MDHREGMEETLVEAEAVVGAAEAVMEVMMVVIMGLEVTLAAMVVALVTVVEEVMEVGSLSLGLEHQISARLWSRFGACELANSLR